MISESRNIIPELLSAKSVSKWFTALGLATGIILLLFSIQMYIDLNNLLNKNSIRKNGYDFISVTKVINNNTMGKDNTFTNNELNDIKSQNFIQNVGPLVSNQFRVKANAGSVVPFTTDLFLESIPSDFLDTIPSEFNWNLGQSTIPIIFSSDFLEMYNVFAPAQGLPQLSDKTISSVNIGLECTGNGKTQNFTGNIVALSDRINSILVPESFMNWANKNFNPNSKIDPERIYLKTTDANAPTFLSYMDQHGYRLNKDKTKFGRAKNILQNMITGFGIFGLLVIVLAIMLFSYYLQLMIANKREALLLLVILGYNPLWISKKVAATWVPLYSIVILISLLCTSLFNYLLIENIFPGSKISMYPNWIVLLIAVLLLIIAVVANFSMVKKNLIRIANR